MGEEKEIMKALIVCFANLRGVPYIYPYINILKKNNIKTDIVYWNRHGIEEKIDCSNLYVYSHYQRDEDNKFIKLIRMYSYTRYVEKIIKKNSYEKIIILSSLPGVLMETYLVKNKKNQYIFDIRDHSYEQFKPYYNRMKKLMQNSALNVISSSGFRNFLPNEDTVICHNITSYTNMKNNHVEKKDKIIISFIGQIRYANKYLNFMESIKNNERIVFRFYGFGEDEEYLKNYVALHKFNNIEFYGAYMPSEKSTIIQKSDILFNVYGSDLHVKYAISNKYYDALIYKKPLLVSKNTTMDDITQGIAFSVDDAVFDAIELIRWYDNIDFVKLEDICEKKLKNVQSDMIAFEKAVESVFTI